MTIYTVVFERTERNDAGKVVVRREVNYSDVEASDLITFLSSAEPDYRVKGVWLQYEEQD